MKKRMLPLLLLAALLLALTGCGEETLLDKNDPVTVNFWHVYGEQSAPPWTFWCRSSTTPWGRSRASGCR